MIHFEIDGVEYVAFVSVIMPEGACLPFAGPDGKTLWMSAPRAA